QEVRRGLRRAAYAAHLGDPVRLDVELEAGLDQRRGDRIVAASGAQGRHAALVVANGVAERVGRQRRVMRLGLFHPAHATWSLSRWSSTAASTCEEAIGRPL